MTHAHAAVGRLAAALFVVLLVPALGAADDEPVPEPGSLEALQAAWEAAPGDLAAGLDYQDALPEGSLRRKAVSRFRKRYYEERTNSVRAFLYGRIAAGEKGLKLMRGALTLKVGYLKDDDPLLLRAWLVLAAAEVDAGNAEEAHAAAVQIITMRGSGADWSFRAWVQEHLLLDAKAAIESYVMALSVEPGNLRASNALVMLLARVGPMLDALIAGLAGASLHPEECASHLHFGLAHAFDGNRRHAARAFDKAFECAGRNVDDLARVGVAYLEIQEFPKTRKALERALAIEPEHGGALTIAALLALDEGRLGEASAFLKRASKVRPKDARIAFMQGVCAQRLGDHSTAVRLFAAALKFEPGRLEYVMALALANLKKGSLTSAVTMLKRAVKIAPEDGDAHLHLGIARLRQRKYKTARKDFEAAAENAPEDPRPHVYLAIIHGDKLGKAQAALEALEAYERLGGEEPTALQWLEDIRKKMGR